MNQADNACLSNFLEELQQFPVICDTNSRHMWVVSSNISHHEDLKAHWRACFCNLLYLAQDCPGCVVAKINYCFLFRILSVCNETLCSIWRRLNIWHVYR